MNKATRFLMGVAVSALMIAASNTLARAQPPTKTPTGTPTKTPAPRPTPTPTLEARDIVVSNATVDITHFVGKEPIDQLDLTALFTNNELAEGKKCEPPDDLIFHGVKVSVQQGFCGANTTKSNVTIHFFQPLGPNSNLANFSGFSLEHATVDALLQTLKTPVGTCGSWLLRIDAINVNLAAIKRNPVAVTITTPDGSSGCLGITSALIDQ